MGHCGLNIKYLIMLRKIRFHRHLFLRYYSFLHDVLLRKSDDDPMLKTVFWTASVAVNYVWT